MHGVHLLQPRAAYGVNGRRRKKIGAWWRKEELSRTESCELQAGERGTEKKNSIYDFIVVYSVFPIYLTD